MRLSERLLVSPPHCASRECLCIAMPLLSGRSPGEMAMSSRTPNSAEYSARNFQFPVPFGAIMEITVNVRATCCPSSMMLNWRGLYPKSRAFPSYTSIRFHYHNAFVLLIRVRLPTKSAVENDLPNTWAAFGIRFSGDVSSPSTGVSRFNSFLCGGVSDVRDLIRGGFIALGFKNPCAPASTMGGQIFLP